MLDRMRDLFTKRLRENWIDGERKASEHTPDWWNISQYRRQLYFAYGNDMPERREYDSLIGSSAMRYGQAYTAPPMTVFSFDGNSEESFPIAMEGQFKYNSPYAPYATLKGELLSIPSETFFKLDQYYANGKVFKRKSISLVVPLIDKRFSEHGVRPTEGIGLASAWMYVGIEDYWHSHLDGGYNFRPAKTFDNLFVREFYFYGSYDFSPD